MATIYRLPGDTDDFVSVVNEGDTKPAVTGGMVPMVEAPDGTMQPMSGSNLGNALATGPATGQVIIAVTGTAVQLGDNALVNGVIVAAHVDNAEAMMVGGSGVTNVETGSGNGFILEPGAMVSFAIDNSNDLFVNGNINDILSFAGS